MPGSTAYRPRVPDLEGGITRLAGSDNLGVALRAIAVNELDRNDECASSPAYWVDVGGAAAPRGLYDLGLDPVAAETLQVGRAFTAYQHFSLVERLSGRVSADTPLVVCSNVARLYDDDDLRQGEAGELCGATATRLAEIADEHDVPLVLTTGPCEDRRLAAIVEGILDRTVRCRRTAQGLRFSGEGVETVAYDLPWGGRQTTFEYWRSVASEFRTGSPTAAWMDEEAERWIERPLEPVEPAFPGVV